MLQGDIKTNRSKWVFFVTVFSFYLNTSILISSVKKLRKYFFLLECQNISLASGHMLGTWLVSAFCAALEQPDFHFRSFQPRNKENQQLIVEQLVNVLNSYLVDTTDVVSNWNGLTGSTDVTWISQWRVGRWKELPSVCHVGDLAVPKDRLWVGFCSSSSDNHVKNKTLPIISSRFAALLVFFRLYS